MSCGVPSCAEIVNPNVQRALNVVVPVLAPRRFVQAALVPDGRIREFVKVFVDGPMECSLVM